MRIAHICLANFYIEGWGYQENILTKHHARAGHDVLVLTSEYMFQVLRVSEAEQKRDYINPYGVRVKVLNYSNRYGWYSRFRDYENVYEELEAFTPDVVFVHGGQFVALKDVIAYCKRHRNVKFYIDQHADYYNSPVKTLKQKVAARFLFGHWIRKGAKLANRIWGVTPWRCQYLREVYGVPKEKIGLLCMGGDDEEIHHDEASQIRTQIRQTLRIPEDAFVIVTGGKIDRTKNIHLLAQAVSELHRENLHLIIFGKPDAEMEETIATFGSEPHCHTIGWVDASRVYDYFLASELAVFPGTHSVLWEQACACGLPLLVKDWAGMHHVCVNGNARFLKVDSVEELKTHILQLLENPRDYEAMKTAARQCMQQFKYSEIAKAAIEEGLVPAP